MSFKNDTYIHPSWRWKVLVRDQFSITSPSIPCISFWHFYISLSIVWLKDILNGSCWYYFTSAYYVQLLCFIFFFTASYYCRLSSLSIIRVVWCKIKDSELQGNCSLIHLLFFLCLSWSTSTMDKLCHF